eukprot:g2282.t1
MPTVCQANEHVVNNTCVACEAGSTRDSGDLTTGQDTACTATVCQANEKVVNNTCVACEAGSTRGSGDLATGQDTACTEGGSISVATGGDDAESVNDDVAKSWSTSVPNAATILLIAISVLLSICFALRNVCKAYAGRQAASKKKNKRQKNNKQGKTSEMADV